MLPPTVTLKPAASSIRPVSVVVVDFPFVPVIAITRPCSQRDASSISPMTGTPVARAACTTGWSGGTPGLSTTRSARANVSRWWPPSSSAHAELPQPLGLRQIGARVGQRHARAAARQQLRGRDAASRRARDGHAFALERRSIHAITAASTSSG